jgi:hypothetical protein
MYRAAQTNEVAICYGSGLSHWEELAIKMALHKREFIKRLRLQRSTHTRCFAKLSAARCAAPLHTQQRQRPDHRQRSISKHRRIQKRSSRPTEAQGISPVCFAQSKEHADDLYPAPMFSTPCHHMILVAFCRLRLLQFMLNMRVLNGVPNGAHEQHDMYNGGKAARPDVSLVVRVEGSPEHPPVKRNLLPKLRCHIRNLRVTGAHLGCRFATDTKQCHRASTR